MGTTRTLDHMIGLDNVYNHYDFSNGSLTMASGDIDGFTMNSDNTYRCTICYRDVKSLTKHRGDYSVAFWGSVILDRDLTPSFTYKACSKTFR